MAHIYVESERWTKRRERAAELKARWPFASEVLEFYIALLDVQSAVFEETQRDQPRANAVAAYVVERVLPRVVEVSVASGPPAMTAAVLTYFHDASLERVVEGWLRGEDLSPVERYLARAASGPVLEALGAAAGDACEGPRDERHCPVCGGMPQLGVFAVSAENLVTAHRYLECSRCAATWAYPRMACAGCGETQTNRLAIYSEIGTAQAEVSGQIIKSANSDPPLNAAVKFPHIRIDGCRTCSRYLLTVNLERDGKAVPPVDEIAAIPLALYAGDLGMTKIAPNLMGF